MPALRQNGTGGEVVAVRALARCLIRRTIVVVGRIALRVIVHRRGTQTRSNLLVRGLAVMLKMMPPVHLRAPAAPTTLLHSVRSPP